ncbi:MAG: hypothetical protein U1D30_22340 [Planctomycetota bacterium]
MNFVLLGEINSHWYLPPLVIAISLVYSATRFEDWRLIFTHAIRWALYILTFLAGAYVLLYLVSVNIDPYLFMVILAALGGCLFWANRRGAHSQAR